MGLPRIPPNVDPARIKFVEMRAVKADPGADPDMEEEMELFYSDTGEVISDSENETATPRNETKNEVGS
jgi:hypothetical protein